MKTKADIGLKSCKHLNINKTHILTLNNHLKVFKVYVANFPNQKGPFPKLPEKPCVNRSNKLLGLIKRTFKALDKDSFLILYKSLVRSILDYGGSVYIHQLKRTFS